MERHEVIAVLESLANGIDPATGQKIPFEAFRLDGNVRALSAAGALLKEDEAELSWRPARRVNPSFPAAGAPWTEEEDVRLAGEHDGGMTVAQIALAHGRTSSAISLRLVKLGRLDASAVKSRQRGMQTEAKAQAN
jgi:hypothetical protein